MVIKGSEILEQNGRKPYPLGALKVSVRHFVVRTTKASNPFEPHKHEQSELWYIIRGHAMLSLNGRERPVEEGDLILLEPWVEHGLRTESEVVWICLG